MLDPRRPQGEPSPADNDERLTRYTAFLPITHKSVLTHSSTLPRIRSIVSSPTALESTSLVAVAGRTILLLLWLREWICYPFRCCFVQA
jgi:hypothetical protein